MIGEIIHVGVTVTNLKQSIEFYHNVLGLELVGTIKMEGAATDKLFHQKGSTAEIAYLKGNGTLSGPPVELIQFTQTEIECKSATLFRTSISEICFQVDDIWAEYKRLTALGVKFLSEPQDFDFTADGFGKSTAVYLKDPDGIILELMQNRN